MADGLPVILVNYALAAVMYTLLGRFALSFLFAPDSPNYIFRAFVRLTDPVLALVRPITPVAVPHMLLILFATVWVLLLRVVAVLALAGALQGG